MENFCFAHCARDSCACYSQSLEAVERGRIGEETQRRAIELYTVERLAPRRVGKELGISENTVRGLLTRNIARMRSRSEACMKYPKTDFSQDPTEAAMILGFMEDCEAKYHRKQILVRTSTTHPAQMKLFANIFGGYGHVSTTPGYHAKYALYQWGCYMYLNDSFNFLIEYKKDPVKYLEENLDPEYCAAHHARLVDAEGTVALSVDKRGHVHARLSIDNNNRGLLEFVQNRLGGSISNHGTRCFQLMLWNNEAVEALRHLTVAHGEKTIAKELILHCVANGGIGVEALMAYRELRRKIYEDVRMCTEEARLEYIRRHGRPHLRDPNQTIPKY